MTLYVTLYHFISVNVGWIGMVVFSLTFCFVIVLVYIGII